LTPSQIAISYTRFSSAKQADGDSERRQVQLADAYAAKHGLTIDQDLRFHDDGKSAFDSTNLHKGALGEFLKLVRAGKIPQGAVLLVENFDRLSRAAPREAYKTFDEIIDAGLTIVTLHNEQKFNSDEVEKNPFLLFSVFIEYIRARSESVAKSKRIKEVWGEKKKQAKATGTVMTRKTPYWIKAKADKSDFELIPERAAVVMRLVEASEKGTGNNTLIRQLHADGVAAWSKSGGWQPSYMQKLLRSPALYGAIRLNDEIVKGYYPALIDEDRFHHLQSLRSDRATTQCTSGRGKTLSNLFSGRLKCGYCGFSMNISGYTQGLRAKVRRLSRRPDAGAQRLQAGQDLVHGRAGAQAAAVDHQAGLRQDRGR
jgi:DNA invertase Pin-like site-specific DNA recombinase